MKVMLFLFVIALAITASNPSSVPTYSVKPGILSIDGSGGPSGVLKEDSIIPDMNVVDGYRTIRYADQVQDARTKMQHEFPLGQQE